MTYVHLNIHCILILWPGLKKLKTLNNSHLFICLFIFKLESEFTCSLHTEVLFLLWWPFVIESNLSWLSRKSKNKYTKCDKGLWWAIYATLMEVFTEWWNWKCSPKLNNWHPQNKIHVLNFRFSFWFLVVLAWINNAVSPSCCAIVDLNNSEFHY